MRLLDLFCGAGGAGWGYALAGFQVVGVDHVEQKNYPLEFIHADVFDLPMDFLCSFDVIHASPPCQFATAYKRKGAHIAPTAVNKIPDTRELLEATGLPYVIENVDQREVRECMIDPIRLCGSSFGLDIRRHRLFESNAELHGKDCDHKWQTPRFPCAGNRANLRSTVEIGVWRIPKEIQREAMGTPWMMIPEMSQAIPPAYTEFIGSQLLSE